jgi:16S rRNA (guanine527-N7)-methyltransferase
VNDPRLERWLEALLATPGLTSIRDPAEARRVHLEQSLVALDQVRQSGSPVVDVGSGGGAPGIPLAVALPDFSFTLLEANGRKCEFLERVTRELPNARVVRGRAEEQQPESFRTALAKALARPPVAVELCLPLVEEGGGTVLYVGPSADLESVRRVAAKLNGEVEDHGSFLFVAKVGPTPPGFPRRPGIAGKRPLA